jgi:hypothetical protein
MATKHAGSRFVHCCAGVLAILVATGFASGAPLLMSTLTHGTPLDGNLLPPREIWIGRLDMGALKPTGETHPVCSSWLPLTSCYLSGSIVGDPRGYRVFASVFGYDTRAPAGTNLLAGGILVLDTVTNSVVGGVMADSYTVRSMFVDPLRPRLFVQSGPFGERLAMIDTRSLNTIATISLANLGGGIGGAVGAVAFDPARSRAYAVGTTPSPNIQPTLVTIDTSTLRVISTSSTYADFSTLLVSFDGATLYAGGSSYLAAMDAANGSTIALASLTMVSPAIVLDSARNRLFVSGWDPPLPGALYGSPKVTVLDARTMETARTFPSLDTEWGLAVRDADSALLAQGTPIDNNYNSPLLAIDPVSGITLASNTTGRGLVPRIDNLQFFRVQNGAWESGVPWSNRSQSVIVLDSLSLSPIGSVALDTRAASDPSRQGTSIEARGWYRCPKSRSPSNTSIRRGATTS